MITHGHPVSRDLIHPDAPPLSPSPPHWVEELFDANSIRHHEAEGDVRIRTAGAVTHASICIRDAIQLDAASLRGRVALAYLAMYRALANLERFPTRFWNFVPGIGQLMSANVDRYMVFNAGRYDAHAEWYGSRHIANDNGSSLATASAVGVTGSDLSIHCLAMEQPGIHVENPRQTPAWQYSTRYGPLPPCFSRATIVTLRGRRHLLIGGTASVVGEDSRHAGDLHGQLDETLFNIESLVRTANGGAGDCEAPLKRLVDLRVYVTQAAQAGPVGRIVTEQCPRARALDIVVAEVCRRELLVEIEGLAEL
jgi:chorismate lyase/3-hydroxybenzoate synthase